jgi:death-on-curing protein
VLYLSIAQVEEIHRRVVRQSGGSFGIRDQGALESSIFQPLQAFGDQELYPSLAEKAAALGYFLVQNHPFIDGNKRVGHAAMETLLILNGFEISATVDEQETAIIALASGATSREDFTAWLIQHVVPIAG